MRKIGIVTFYKSENYGAFLQCFALQYILQKTKNHPYVIEYTNEREAKKSKLIDTSNLKRFAISAAAIFHNLKRKASFRKAQKMLNMGSPKEQYDIAITGSDQVWNPSLSGNEIDPYFSLEQIDAKKKISYAASAGSKNYIKKYKLDFESIANRLEHISVREESSAKEIQKLTSKKVAKTLDPTLLITKDEWSTLLSNTKKINGDYIVSYFIGKERKRGLAEISKKTGLKTLSYAPLPTEANVLKHCFSDGPFEFINNIKNSKLVVTASFHGVVFSIIFNKNFFVLKPNKNNRERIDCLLETLNIKNRIIEDESQIKHIDLNETINYEPVNRKLDRLRAESLNWLKNAIEN